MQRGFFIQAIGVVALVFAGLGALFLNGAKGAFVWIHLLAATLLFLVGTLQSKRAVRSAAGGAAAGLQISHGIWMKILTALLFAAVLVAVNLVAIRFDARWDLTESNVHTLSKESVEITELISQPLRIVALASSKRRQQLDGEVLLSLYQRLKPDLIEVQFVSPTRNPFLVDRLGFRAGEVAHLEYTVNGKTDGRKLTQLTEDAVTQVIYELTQGRRKTIYYIEGHGEPDLHSSADEGVSFLAAAVQSSGLNLKGLVLAGLTALPSDTAAVLLASPKTELPKAEFDMLKDYLSSGGSALLLRDPQTGQSVLELARQSGIEIGADVVVDPSQRYQGMELWQIAANNFEYHPITKNLGRNNVVVFLAAATVTPLRRSSASETYVQLVKSSRAAWAESGLTALFSDPRGARPDAEEKRGILPLAVAYSKIGAIPPGGGVAPETRVVVVGDTEWLRNMGLSVYSNKEFALNSLNWLAKRDSALGLRPRSLRTMLKPVPQVWVGASRLVVIIFLEVFVIVGFLIWRRRRLLSW